jgi:hypothetical protein
MFQNLTPSKRALARQTESPSSLKKRKQMTMDDYVSTVCSCPCMIDECVIILLCFHVVATGHGFTEANFGLLVAGKAEEMILKLYKK